MEHIVQLLDQIEATDQKASPGPWQSDGDAIMGATYRDHNALLAPFLGDVMQSNDAEFIVLARTALPQLSKALRAVLAECDKADQADPFIIFGGDELPKMMFIDSVRQAITEAAHG